LVIFGQCLWALEAYKRGVVGGATGATGPVLVLSFLCGLLFFLYRDVIVLSRSLFIAALAVSIGLLLLPHGTYLVAIPATYVTVYLGLLSPRKVKYLFAGDYSYGIYLYGYPIQQAFASLGPWAQHWYLSLIVCLPAAFIVAYFSWNVVEKPTLALRRYLPPIERKLLGLAYGAGGVIAGLGREGVVSQLFSFSVFVAGIGTAALLLDSHEALGLYSALACFSLLILSVRYKKFVAGSDADLPVSTRT
jgi:peptidoglycan/LPS O-acetylase OafA/YrhL